MTRHNEHRPHQQRGIYSDPLPPCGPCSRYLTAETAPPEHRTDDPQTTLLADLIREGIATGALPASREADPWTSHWSPAA